MAELLISSLVSIFSWPTIGMLFFGVIVGIMVGIIPGIGGYFVLAILIPFVYNMDPLPALALLLGAHAVSDIGGAITACLFNVPGTGQNIATCFDGYVITQKGEGGRAVAASLVSSATGAVIGAVIFLLMIPIVKPLILLLGSGDFFILVALGIVCIGSLLGDEPMKGLMMGSFGLLLATVGQDPTVGTIRFDFGQMYLWDGIKITPVVIGLVAISEMVNLAIKGGSIAEAPKGKFVAGKDMINGTIDTLKNWWLVLWCSVLGFIVGFIPGLGGQAASFIAYGMAAKRAKDRGSFGQGNIQGVIAPETANSSKEGGALLPTLAFGVPGSGGMAILIGVLIMLGIVPGPSMFKEHLQLTVTLGLIIAIGNILGTLVAFIAVRPFIRLTYVRVSLLVCPVLMFAITGGYTASSSLGDLMIVYIFAVLGFFMKKYRYPTPPLVLGLVLGRLAELNFNVALAAYGPTFMFQRPLTSGLTILVILLAIWPLIAKIFRKRKSTSADLTEGGK